MARSDLIVVWGGNLSRDNPVSTQINVMTHVATARKERSAKLVVIDPYRTATAEQADLHLATLPGTDGALACAVMHVLFEEGYADHDYMARYTDDPRGLAAHLRSRLASRKWEPFHRSTRVPYGAHPLHGATTSPFAAIGARTTA